MADRPFPANHHDARTAATRAVREEAWFDASFARHDSITLIGGTFALVAAVGPALGASGFLPEWGLPFPVLCLIAGAGCAVGFALWYTDRRYWQLGAIAGLFSGPLIMFATMLYVAFRSSIWGMEILVQLVVGGLPGYWWWRRRLKAAVLADRQTDGGICRVCGYDLRATPNRCPECGTKVEDVAAFK